MCCRRSSPSDNGWHGVGMPIHHRASYVHSPGCMTRAHAASMLKPRPRGKHGRDVLMIKKRKPAKAQLDSQGMHPAGDAFDTKRKLAGASSHRALGGNCSEPLKPHLQPDVIIAHDVCHGPGGDVIITRAPGAAACAQRSSLKLAQLSQLVMRLGCNNNK